jgi:hypothetical protein
MCDDNDNDSYESDDNNNELIQQNEPEEKIVEFIKYPDMKSLEDISGLPIDEEDNDSFEEETAEDNNKIREDLTEFNTDTTIDEGEDEIVEGYWDCPPNIIAHNHNNPVQNDGEDIYCHICQKERSRNVKFYNKLKLKDGIVTDEKGKIVHTIDETEDESKIYRQSQLKQTDTWVEHPPLYSSSSAIHISNYNTSKRIILTGIGITIGIIALILLYYSFIYKTTIELKLVKLKWQTNTIVIADVIKSGEGYQPMTDYKITSSERIIVDYFDRQVGIKTIREPVYKTYYKWTYKSREKVATYSKKGEKGQKLSWKKPVKNKYKNPILIEGNTIYSLVFKDNNDKQYYLIIDKSKWDKYVIGNEYIAEINNTGIISNLRTK